MTVLHTIISQTGMITPSTLLWPLLKATPRKSTPMNFWPSWAPCMKLMAAAPKISPAWKKRLVLCRFIPAQMIVISLQITHPDRKPRARLRNRP